MAPGYTLFRSLQNSTIAIACSPAPDGYTRWTLRMLSARLVELEAVEEISHESVRDILKKKVKPWQHQQWCIPRVGVEFVSEMKNVLGIYHFPYNPQRPVVCLDEKVYYLLLTENLFYWQGYKLQRPGVRVG